MKLTRPQLTAAWLLAALCLLLAFTMTGGCERIAQVDKLLWTTPDAPAGSPGQPGIPADPNAPTIGGGLLQSIAAGLALAGYPGLAAWIHKNRKNGTARVVNLENAVSHLEDELELLKKDPAG